MIDYFDITFKGEDFPEIGKSVQTLQPSGTGTQSFTEVNVRDATGAPHFKTQIETKAKRMRFWGSPAQWLQAHNGMGSNDFQAVVKASIPLVFKTLKKVIPASIQAALETGDYEVHESHVAEQYRMPHALIGPLCDNIRRFADASMEAVPLVKGIGIRLWPHSRSRQVLMYDKHHYFMDKLLKHKRMLMGNMPQDLARIGVGMDFDRMMSEFLAQGIRIETRFKRYLNNKDMPLNRGALWLPNTARELHSRMVSEIPLYDMLSTSREEVLLNDATIEQQTLIALWLAGHDVQRFCGSPATYFRRRADVLKTHGIDLSIPPMPDSGIAWSDLIATGSIIEPPAWAIESGFLHEPKQWIGWQHPTQNERAWLHPEPEYRRGGRALQL
jgi:hypothetical protein